MSRVESKARGFHGGEVIADRYELRELVGEGGMGAVWRARHIQLESDVALKLMSPSIAAQPEALHRFLREARAAARLTSLHVVKVFDFGVHGETPFIAMELLTGESLRQRLDREGALSPKVTSWVMRHATRALSKAHGEGIVHRDLKPENLFITTQEEEILKVLDFGVAKLSGATPGSLGTSTRTGAVLGTPFYMSPEQARGIKAIDHRSDIWSLGVIAYECLTGKLPFDSEGFGDLVLKICTLPPPVPSSVAPVPAGFDAWFARAVERDPEQRYQSVDEMFDALQVAFHGSLALATTMNADGAPLPVQPPTVAHATSKGTLTDGTAAQSVMVQIPKRGMSPRAWVFSLAALMSLVGLGAVWTFGSTRQATGDRRTTPAASATPRPALDVPLEQAPNHDVAPATSPDPAAELAEKPSTERPPTEPPPPTELPPTELPSPQLPLPQPLSTQPPRSEPSPSTELPSSQQPSSQQPSSQQPPTERPPSTEPTSPTIAPVPPEPSAAPSSEAPSEAEPLRSTKPPPSPAATRARAAPSPKTTKRTPSSSPSDLFSNPD